MTTPETTAAQDAERYRNSDIEALRAQVEQYREDAERYRWLREKVKPQSNYPWHVMDRSIRINGDFDAAIDKARKA